MKRILFIVLAAVLASGVFAEDWELKTLDKAIRKNKWDPELYAERGQYYYEHGLYEKAMDDYMKAYGLDKAEVDYAIEAARCMHMLGDEERAGQMLDLITAAEPKKIDAWLLWSDIEYGRALDSLNRLMDQVDLDPDDLFYYVGTRARIYLNSRAYHEAILDLQRLQKMLDEGVINPFIAYQSSQVNRESYHFYEAAKNYTDLIHYYDDAFQPDLLFERGKCYEFAGIYGMAIRDFTQIIEQEEVNDYQADAYLHRGLISEIQQLYEPALRDYNNGLLVDETSSGLHLYRGRLLLEAYKDTLNAKLDFEYILKHDTACVLSSRIFALAFLGQKEEAVERLDKCTPEFPNEQEFYVMASVYARLGMTDRALNCLESSLNIGFRAMELIDDDPDMDSLRSNEQFKELIARYKEIRTIENMGFYEEDDEPDVDVDMREGEYDE